MKVALKESSGYWKENVITQKWEKACTTLKNIIGNEWTAFVHGNGLRNTKCPILPVKTLIIIITIFDLGSYYFLY